MKALVCGLLATGVVVLAACSVTIETKTPEAVPLIGGTEIKIHIEAGRASIPPTPGVPQGACIKIVWLGADGQPLGETELTVGGEAKDIPEGAEDLRLEPCDPPDESPAHKVRQRSFQQPFVTDQLRAFAYRHFPVDLSDGEGRYVEYIVTAHSEEEADQLADQIGASLFQEALDPRVEMWGAAEAELLEDGRVRYTVFSDEAPGAFAFEWNGTDLFDLSDAVVQAANGWYATTVHVPSALVDSTPTGAENVARYALTLSTREVGLTTSFAFEP